MDRNEKVENVKIVVVIKVKLTRGTGAKKEDPVREVIQYWDLNGTLIADNDAYLRTTIELASSEISS